MPPHIQPKGLQATVLVHVTHIIIKLCVDIEHRFGSFDCCPCQQAVSGLQIYLLPKVRPFLDYVCDEVSHDDLSRLNDKRIFYALVVHRKTKRLNFNGLLSRSSADYIPYQMFCIDQISKLDNLVSLHICQNNMCKSVLKTIADTCYKSLEAITITPVFCEFADYLLYLQKCKELRYLKIIAYSSWCRGGSLKKSLESLRLLIKSLPKLEFFNSRDMIKILSEVEVGKPLSLIKLVECDTKLNEISHLIKICPKLQDINIGIVSSSSYEGPDILNAISSSSLCLTNLVLQGFSCQSQINQLLAAKGTFLISINLDNTFHAMTHHNISTIGKCCPNLENLDLDVSSASFHDGIDTEATTTTIPVFTKLESLCLGWYKVDSDTQSILPLILHDANQVNALKLQCSTSLQDQDVLSDLLSSSPLTMLTKLSLIVNGPGTISHQSMACLIERCPKLSECYIYCRIRREAHSFLQELHGRIIDENLDFEFDVFEK